MNFKSFYNPKPQFRTHSLNQTFHPEYEPPSETFVGDQAQKQAIEMDFLCFLLKISWVTYVWRYGYPLYLVNLAYKESFQIFTVIILRLKIISFNLDMSSFLEWFQRDSNDDFMTNQRI